MKKLAVDVRGLVIFLTVVVLLMGTYLFVFGQEWQWLAFLRILVASVGVSLVNKKLVSFEIAKAKSVFMAYFFCLFLASSFALMVGQMAFDRSWLIVFVMGLFNGVAIRCNWMVTDMSQSRSSILKFWDDIIAMGLSYYILNESQFMTSTVWWGMAFSLGAIILFVRHFHRKKISGKEYLPIYFFILIGVYSVIWGSVTFMENYLAVEGVPPGKFLFGWYSGSFTMASVLLIFHIRKINKIGYVNNKEEASYWQVALWGLFFSAGAALAIYLQFRTYSISPLVIVQPLFMVADTIFPVLIGLFVFKEIKKVDRIEWLYFAIGLTGSMLIISSY